MLEIRDLSKSYRKRSALRHVDLKFDHGIYAILGPNGSEIDPDEPDLRSAAR